jgi:hypothetical protein
MAAQRVSDAEMDELMKRLRERYCQPDLTPGALLVLKLSDKEAMQVVAAKSADDIVGRPCFRLCCVLEAFTEAERQTWTATQRKKFALLLERGLMKPEEVETCVDESPEEKVDEDDIGRNAHVQSETSMMEQQANSSTMTQSRTSHDVYLRVFDGTLVSV